MSEPIVTMRNVSKRFGAKAALADVSADVQAGDIIGVLGKNGAGKTTLLEVLLGFSPPNEGSAAVFGEDSMRLSAAAKAKIGFVPQQDELLAMLNGQQQLAITAAFHANWDRALVDRLVAEWNVPTDRRISTLSVGERQKLSVLTALGHQPQLLVLDEPVASLDPIARRQFLRQLFDIAEDRDSRRAVLVAHRLGSRARREQGLDHQRRPVALAGRDRRAQGVGRARAHPRACAAASGIFRHRRACRARRG